MSNGTYITYAPTGEAHWFSREEINAMLDAADFFDIDDAVFSIPSKLADQTWTFHSGFKRELQAFMRGIAA